MIKIVGVRQFQGVYEGHNFNKMNVYALSDVQPSGVECFGYTCNVYKFTYSKFYEILRGLGLKSADELLNREIINVYYDQYKHPVMLELKK